MLTKIVSLIVAILCAVSIAFGQESGKTTFFPTPDACKLEPANTVNEYQPIFSDNLAKWQALVHEDKAELIENHGKTYCAEEWSMEGQTPGKHIIRWPANNPYYKGADGKIADGRCGNTVYRLWEVPPPTPASPPPPRIYYTPPSPTPAPPPSRVSIPAGPPSCVVYGNRNDGYTGAGFGGIGVWISQTGSISGNHLQPPAEQEPGVYSAVYRVTGKDGQVRDCPKSWEVPVPVTEAPPEEVPPGFCEAGHNWFVTSTGVQIRCHPVRTAIVTAVVGGCVAEIVISHGAGAFLPPCGLFTKKPPPVKDSAPVYSQPAIRVAK